MDSAKAVAFLAAQGGGTILDYLAGGPHATLEGTKPAFPIICVTTTAELLGDDLLVGDHEHEMARETGNGQRQHHGALAIMVTNNENYPILLKIGGLSRFKFN